MSRIRADKYTNRVGTGAPGFTNGLAIGTGTSIKSPATNTLIFDTNSTERVRITSAGLVGLNQTTPQTTFHSTGTTNGQQATFGVSSSGLKISTFQKTDNDAGVILDAQQSSNGTLTFATSGTERVRIDSSGRLLVGETTSSGSENINCSGSSTGATGLFIHNKNGATDSSANLWFGNWSGSTAAAPQARLQAINTNTNNASTALAFSVYNGTSILERMRITSAGLVGIGTDTPSDNLQITNSSGGGSIYLGIGNKDDQYQYINFGGNAAGQSAWQIGRAPANGGIAGTANGFYLYNLDTSALAVGINSTNQLITAPSGMVMRSGFYDTGYGSNARTQTNSQSWVTVNINGTGQVGHNIGKAADDVLTFNKVSSNSHLNISISFPYYLAAGSGLAGFGIRCLLSTNDGSNYYVLSGLTNGPANAWGAGGYGGNESGILSGTWNTRMNSSQASTILAKTGSIRLYFECRVWTTTETVYMIDYPSYNKKGSVVIQEIAE